eukprot:scaffold1583_cov299-Pinguiococcus_pyrenoidosus.AAC.27
MCRSATCCWTTDAVRRGGARRRLILDAGAREESERAVAGASKRKPRFSGRRWGRAAFERQSRGFSDLGTKTETDRWTKCKVQSAKCKVQNAKCKVPSGGYHNHVPKY